MKKKQKSKRLRHSTSDHMAGNEGNIVAAHGCSFSVATKTELDQLGITPRVLRARSSGEHVRAQCRCEGREGRPCEMSVPSQPCLAWTETRKGDRWDRTDGACVRIDHSVECSTSKPWLPNYRGWKAWGPGDHDLLAFKRRSTRLRRSRFRIARKFKTAASAMKAVDAEYPLNDKAQILSEAK